MDNAQKAIMIGVGLFITIIIISAVLLITNIGTNMINSSREQLSGITQALQNQVISTYDGKTMNGSEVISACQLYERSEMSIIISYKLSATGRGNMYTGKYIIDPNTATIDPDISPSTSPLPGGYSYSGDLVALTDKTRASITKLQMPINGTSGGAGVSATKTYYSSIIKDAETGTVIGMIFYEA